jgi:UDP-N-acetylmuramate dehydrogenase
MTLLSRFQQSKLLSELSTFGIGGPARYFIEVSKIEEMQEILGYCAAEKLRFIVIGKGSNTLFDDRGFDGLVILNKIAFCDFLEEGKVSVGAGYSFSLLGVQTARKKLAGLEFASGIPASVGGAIYMNAGASGSETCQPLSEISFVSDTGKLLHFSKEQLMFSYRTSSFQTMKGAIVAAKFQLTPSDEARPKQLEIVDYRTRTQPYGDKSAGCVFRNPVGASAGALIEKAGLKGYKVGGAQVSALHANFIINAGGATACDVLDLAKHVQRSVHAASGNHLEMEVRTIPYQDET